MNSNKLIIAACIAAVCMILPLTAQNMKDDIQSNNLDALKAKVELLEPDMSTGSFLADYLRDAKFQPEMFDYLMSKNAGISVKDSSGVSPLVYACRKNYTEAALKLIAAKADVEAVDSHGMGPLYYAITSNNATIVQALIDAKVNVEAKWTIKVGHNDDSYSYSLPSFFDKRDGNFYRFYDTNGESYAYKDSGARIYETTPLIRPLYTALVCTNPAIVPLLLKAGADPDDIIYKLPIEDSSKKEKKYITNTVFDYMIARLYKSALPSNSDQERRYSDDYNYDNPPSPAFFANSYALWQNILSRPAGKQSVPEAKYTSNMYAYFCTGNMKAFKQELITTGANTMAFLPYAALAGSWDIVNLILQYNQISIDEKFTANDSLMTWAIVNNYDAVVKMLFDHDAALPETITIKTRDRDNKKNPLVLAVQNDNAPIAAALIAHGADVNAVDEDTGKTPLTMAVSHNNAAIVKMLIDAKADVNLKVPLFYADSSAEIRNQLVSAGADVTTIFTAKFEGPCNDYSDTIRQDYMYSTKADLLYFAAAGGNTDAVQYYLDQGLSAEGIADGTADETHPVFAAILSGKPEVMNLLLAHGADPNVRLNNEIYLKHVSDDVRYGTPRTVASYFAEHTDDPVAKGRYTKMVKLLAAAKAKVPSKPLAPSMVNLSGSSPFTVTYTDGYHNMSYTTGLAPFTISCDAITERQYFLVEGKHSYTYTYADCTYNETAQFCNDLSQRNGLTPFYTITTQDNNTTITFNRSASGYRLPTEAELSYAALQTENKELKESFKYGWCLDPWLENPPSADHDTAWEKQVNEYFTACSLEKGYIQRDRCEGSGRCYFRVVRNIPQ